MILVLQILGMVAIAAAIPAAFVVGIGASHHFVRLWPYLAGLIVSLLLFALLVAWPFLFWVRFGT